MQRRRRKTQLCGKRLGIDEDRAQEMLYFAMQYLRFKEDAADIEAVAKEVAGDQWQGFLAGVCVSKFSGYILPTLERNGFTKGKNEFVRMRIRFIELLDVVRERREQERHQRRRDMRNKVELC